VFVIAYTGPGGGTEPANTSEGLPAGHDGGRRLFDTIPDPRGSWFWGHAVAAMRALTCLEGRGDVDGSRLGITGFSAGGVVSLMVAAVDPRVKASVPLSASGAWDVATLAPAAWQHGLLSAAGLSITSPEWLRLEETLDAARLVPGTTAQILMVNGSTDEFFPLTAHRATFDAIPGEGKRTSIAANFDHGCYALTGVESAATIEARASLRAEGGQRLWFGHWFGTDARYAYVPRAPVVTLQSAGGATLVVADVDPGGSALEVDEVKIWWSNDDSLLYGAVVLEPAGGTLYAKLAAFPLLPNTISFADVVYRTRDLFPERFSLSSPPAIPPGVVPHIRSVQNCL
jgi:dienelactone hydrolase